MILSEVEETITTVEIDEETFEELFKVRYTHSKNIYICDVIIPDLGLSLAQFYIWAPGTMIKSAYESCGQSGQCLSLVLVA